MTVHSRSPEPNWEQNAPLWAVNQHGNVITTPENMAKFQQAMDYLKKHDVDYTSPHGRELFAKLTQTTTSSIKDRRLRGVADEVMQNMLFKPRGKTASEPKKSPENPLLKPFYGSNPIKSQLAEKKARIDQLDREIKGIINNIDNLRRLAERESPLGELKEDVIEIKILETLVDKLYQERVGVEQEINSLQNELKGLSEERS